MVWCGTRHEESTWTRSTAVLLFRHSENHNTNLGKYSQNFFARCEKRLFICSLYKTGHGGLTHEVFV